MSQICSGLSNYNGLPSLPISFLFEASPLSSRVSMMSYDLALSLQFSIYFRIGKSYSKAKANWEYLESLGIHLSAHDLSGRLCVFDFLSR